MIIKGEAMLRIVMLLACVLVLGCGEAKIEKECVMNGFGKGTCTFTNLGDAVGGMCGKIKVFNVEHLNHAEIATSATICSGEIEPKSSKDVEFMAAGVRDGCKPPSVDIDYSKSREEIRAMRDQQKSWNDICAFDFDEVDAS